MLTGCDDLLQCEQRLAFEIPKIQLLGQINLSRDDVEKLANFIREQMASGIRQGTAFLLNQAPACFACFLVWQGILYYKEGDYWSAVQEAIGPLPQNWLSRWGEIFIDFLRQNQLPLFEVQGANRYLTPILTHGGIPNYCLNEFFEKALMPMIWRDLFDPSNREEIVQQIRRYREDNEKREVIESQLRELKNKRTQLSREVKKVRQLMTLSDQLTQLRALESEAGDVEELRELRGCLTCLKTEKVEEIQQLRIETHNIEREIQHCHELAASFIPRHEHIIRSHSQTLNTELQMLLKQYYRVTFATIDKPIRRFLLYGGVAADEFLISAVQMAHRRFRGENASSEKIHLPVRVIKAFENWWEDYQCREKPPPPEPGDDSVTDGFHSPQVIFDPAPGEITVGMPQQNFPATIGEDHVCLEVVGSDSDIMRRYDLRVYRGRNGSLETEAIENIPLPYPSEWYEFRLKSNGGIINSWRFPGVSAEQSYIAFDYHVGKLITSENLPRKEIWLVVPTAATLSPSQSILEETSLSGKWKNYKAVALSLSNVKKATLRSLPNEEFPLPLAEEIDRQIELVGGNLIAGVTANDAPVYADRLPDLRIPIKHPLERRLWRLFIRPDEGSIPGTVRDYRLSELPTTIFRNGEGFTDLCLIDDHLLGAGSVGRFTLHVKGPHQKEEQFTFCILAGLSVQFDKGIYFPIEESDASTVRVAVSLQDGIIFEAFPPAQLINRRENQFEVLIDHAENIVAGRVHYRSSDGEPHEIPLEIQMPKIQWRIQGVSAEWCDYIKEIWFGDWEDREETFLDIRMPESVTGRAKLTCGLHEMERRIHNGQARFDLRQFNDTLRGGSVLETFEVFAPDSEFFSDKVLLFRVCTRWAVESIECLQKIEGETRILQIHWEEKGTFSGQKVVRLWKLWDRGAEPIKASDNDNAHEVSFYCRFKELPDGEYRLQIDVEDEWSEMDAAFPNENDPNTQDVCIQPIYRCKQAQCHFVASDEMEMFSHIAHHLESFIQHLAYEEIRQIYNRPLPEKIYGCVYCRFYCCGNYPSPTSTITQHISNKHLGSSMSFRIVQNIDEIRQHVIRDLPRLYKCRLCGTRFKEYNPSAVKEHLVRHHKDEMYLTQ